MNERTQIALSYLKQGLSIIPLISPSMASKKLSKEELIKKCKTPPVSWKEYQSRLPTEKEVIEWFTKWPDANIGIVTGKISNLVVFDLDSDDAVDYAENEGGFPFTAKVKTGKGYHIYARYPGFEVRNDVDTKLAIDIRADGGYVAAPPSIHGSGASYEWEKGFSIFEIDPAPCEQWMIEYLKDVAASSAKPKKEKPLKPSERAVEVTKAVDGDSYADILKNGAKTGNRNHTAAKLIGHLFGKGNDEDVVWELVNQWNTSKCNPPIDYSELLSTFESIRDLEKKKEKKEEKVEDIDVTAFLDTTETVATEYDEKYNRIPFAGTLLPIMESKMNGGLIGGRTYIIGGIPSASKTALVNNLGDNICLNGHPVLFFSYDDGRSEIRNRTYSRFSGFDIEDFNNRRLSTSDIKTICGNDNISAINKLKYVVESSIKIENWAQLINKINARHKKSPVIIVDYLRKVKTGSNRYDERLRVDEILNTMTDLAKAHNIPVVIISELARDSYKTGQRLSMASFKESGTIEYEASWLGILAAVEEDGFGYSLKNDWERIINHDGNVDLIVFKAKRGTGETGRIPLKLDKLKMTVRDRIECTKADSVMYMKKTSKFD